MENNNNKSLADIIKTQFEEYDCTEITLVSTHGIETKISKNDNVSMNNTVLHISKEDGGKEIILFTDHIFKIIIK